MSESGEEGLAVWRMAVGVDDNKPKHSLPDCFEPNWAYDAWPDFRFCDNFASR